MMRRRPTAAASSLARRSRGAPLGVLLGGAVLALREQQRATGLNPRSGETWSAWVEARPPYTYTNRDRQRGGGKGSSRGHNARVRSEKTCPHNVHTLFALDRRGNAPLTPHPTRHAARIRALPPLPAPELPARHGRFGFPEPRTRGRKDRSLRNPPAVLPAPHTTLRRRGSAQAPHRASL